MLTCNLLLTICLLQVNPQRSFPGTAGGASNARAQMHISSPPTASPSPTHLRSRQGMAAQSAAIAGRHFVPDPGAEHASARRDPATFFPHSDTARYWISGQANSIFQMHGNFHSPYQGPNSFTAPFEYKASEVGTLYLGYQLNKNPRYETDVLYDEENAGGRGLSQALGLAGFTNLDVVRNPNLGPTPYTARVELHQTIGFTNETVPQQRRGSRLATQVPVRRLDCASENSACRTRSTSTQYSATAISNS